MGKRVEEVMRDIGGTNKTEEIEMDYG